MRPKNVNEAWAINKRNVHLGDTVLRTWTLQLFGPIRERVQSPTIGPQLLRETEENLTDLLPEGYSVRIREWDEEETPDV